MWYCSKGSERGMRAVQRAPPCARRSREGALLATSQSSSCTCHTSYSPVCRLRVTPISPAGAGYSTGKGMLSQLLLECGEAVRPAAEGSGARRMEAGCGEASVEEATYASPLIPLTRRSTVPLFWHTSRPTFALLSTSPALAAPQSAAIPEQPPPGEPLENTATRPGLPPAAPLRRTRRTVHTRGVRPHLTARLRSVVVMPASHCCESETTKRFTRKRCSVSKNNPKKNLDYFYFTSKFAGWRVVWCA